MHSPKKTIQMQLNTSTDNYKLIKNKNDQNPNEIIKNYCKQLETVKNNWKPSENS